MQSASATGLGDASNLVQNDGTLNIHATAIANGVTGASATADLVNAISQSATADEGDATNSVINNATMNIVAIAHANATSGRRDGYPHLTRTLSISRLRLRTAATRSISCPATAR